MAYTRMGVVWTIIVVTASLLAVALIVLAAFAAWVGAMAVLVAWSFPGTSPPPPADPTPCPACGHTDHDYRLGGLWDGVNRATGKLVGGSFTYAACNRCGCRWAQWDDAPAYVASDEEWEREVLQTEAAAAAAADRSQRT